MTPDTPGAPLRIGLLVDSIEQPAWIAEAIRRSLEGRFAEIVLVIRNSAPAAADQSRSRLKAWVRNRRALVHAAYNRLDRWKFSVERDPFAPASLAEQVHGTPIIDVVPRQTRFSDYFADDDVERIASYDLDVAVRLGFRILRGRALRIARHGVWSYHHGDSTMYRGGPPGFWEVMEGNPVTGAVLQVLGESLDDGEVLARIWSKTARFSVRTNRARYYWQAAPLLSRKLRDLYLHGAEGISARVDSQSPSAYSARLYVAPGNAQMAREGVKLAAGYLRSHLNAVLTREQWMIGYYRAPTSDGATVELPCLSAHRYKLLSTPNDRFWADPFPIRFRGRDFVFFEEYLEREGKAHISVLEIGAKGPLGEPVRALTCDYHLSYPCVFEHEGVHYMIPETGSTQRVELWRATTFPDQWELDRVLLEGTSHVDATPACIDGRWWLFAAGTEAGDGAWDDLYLYHASRPTGPWIPHPQNPVVTDVRCARPAGRLFRHRDSWYRPAQDGSRSYGGAIAIQRIVRIDDRVYEECPATRIDPRWRPDLVGVHTLNASAGLSVIDVRRRRWIWRS